MHITRPQCLYENTSHRFVWINSRQLPYNSMKSADAYIYALQNQVIVSLGNNLSPVRRQAIHYLNQHWIILIWTLRNKLQWNLNKNTTVFIQQNAFENVICKMAAIFFSENGTWREPGMAVFACIDFWEELTSALFTWYNYNWWHMAGYG